MHSILPEKTLIPKTKNSIAISCFTKSSMVVTQDGEVYGFGTNLKGRLGLPKEEDYKIPTQVPNLVNIVQIDSGYFHSLAVDSAGNAWSSGQGTYGELGRNSL